MNIGNFQWPDHGDSRSPSASHVGCETGSIRLSKTLNIRVSSPNAEPSVRDDFSVDRSLYIGIGTLDFPVDISTYTDNAKEGWVHVRVDVLEKFGVGDTRF